MNTSEKFCLKWNDFSENLISTFSELRTAEDLVDVTLACEDGTQIEAHKVVLTAGSNIFKTLLKRKRRETPIIYMRGLKSSDLSAIVEFMYIGEVNIQEEELEAFLSLAEELQIKGLVGGGNSRNSVEGKAQSVRTNVRTNSHDKKTSNLLPKLEDVYNEFEKGDKSAVMIAGEPFVQSMQVVGLSDDLQQKMEELIKWNGKSWSCKVCGKLATTDKTGKKNLKRHTQTHMNGLLYPCNVCGKEFRCKANLDTHTYKNHKSTYVSK